MAEAKAPIPPECLERYNALIEAHPKIDIKGKTNPYTSLNGNMFTFLRADGVMGLRLSQDERDRFIEMHNTDLIVSHDRVMKEYVEVPNALWEDTAAMKKYLRMSHAYAKTLKPKPTKKPKPTEKSKPKVKSTQKPKKKE